MSARAWARWLGLRGALLAAYAGVILVALGGEPRAVVGALAIALGVTAGVASARGRDEVRARGACSAGALVLAVMHARLAPADAPWLGLQLGLAAGVAGSAAATLIAERAARRGLRPGAVATAVTIIVGLAVVGPAIAEHGARLVPPAIVMLGLAALRPLGALGEVAAAAGVEVGPRDPLAWWRPVLEETEARR